MKSSATCALVLALASYAGHSRASVEAFGLPDRTEAENLAALRLGMEPVPLLELGYTRPKLFRISDHAFDVGAALAAPLLLVPDASDLRFSAGVASSWELARVVQLTSGFSTFWATADDTTARSHAFGIEAGAGVRYAPGGFYLGLPVRLRSTLLLHLDHSELIRDAYGDRYDNGSTNTPVSGDRIDGPHDGWYGWSAWRVFLGLEGGFSVSSVAFNAGAGTFLSPQEQGLFFSAETGQIPIYLEIGARVGF